MLAISSLSKAYHTERRVVPVLHDVSFAVGDGEFVAIVGPSGCGKSTLLKCIAGLERPTTGSVTLLGKPVIEPTSDIGFVFQQFALFPWLTVAENIAFGPRRQGLTASAIDDRVRHYLNAIDLAAFADAYPSQLSGGMQQRLEIARTLANDPKVVMMDEPFGSLDAFSRETMQEFLLNLWQQDRKTIVFVTHDIEEAILLADRIIVLGKHEKGLHEVIDVPFVRPRHADVKYDPTFIALRQRIATMLGSMAHAGIEA